MLRFKIKEMISKKEFADDRRITIGEVAEATGIHRMTLSKMINQRGYNAGADNLDRLCEYFDCRIEDLVEYVSAERVPGDGE
ncbi:MAG: helix-turn-helix transcriptional regulator [Sedimenticola sp.]